MNQILSDSRRIWSAAGIPFRMITTMAKCHSFFFQCTKWSPGEHNFNIPIYAQVKCIHQIMLQSTLIRERSPSIHIPCKDWAQYNSQWQTFSIIEDLGRALVAVHIWEWGTFRHNADSQRTAAKIWVNQLIPRDNKFSKNEIEYKWRSIIT